MSRQSVNDIAILHNKHATTACSNDYRQRKIIIFSLKFSLTTHSKKSSSLRNSLGEGEPKTQQDADGHLHVYGGDGDEGTIKSLGRTKLKQTVFSSETKQITLHEKPFSKNK